MKILFALLFLVVPFHLHASQNVVWGKIVTLEQSFEGVMYKHFVYFEKDGKVHAYPIETNRKDIVEILRHHSNQKVRIEGDVREISLKIDGPPKKILVFVPKSVKPLQLSELALSSRFDTSEQSSLALHSKKKHEYDGGGIRISDQAADTMIYTGAAIILGPKVLEIINKKK